MLVLSACSKPEETPPSARQEEVPAPAEKVELVFYTEAGGSQEAFDQQFGNVLRKKFPNYTIKYIEQHGPGTYLKDLLAAGTQIDVYYHSVGYFLTTALPNAIQYDMSELIKTHKVDLNSIEPVTIEGFRNDADGKILALPIFTDSMVTYYNKDLFDKFGVQYPSNGMTWDSFNEMAKKLSRMEGDTQYFGYLPMMQYLFYTNPLSIPAVDRSTLKPTINTDRRWELFFDKLVSPPGNVDPAAKKYMPRTAIEVLEGFVQGKQGMMVYVSALINSWHDKLDKMNFDIVSPPAFSEQPGVGTQPYGVYMGVTSMSKNKGAAMEAIKHLLSEEVQTTYARNGRLPVLRSEKVRSNLGQDTKFKDINWQAVFASKLANVPYKGPYATSIENVYMKYANAVMFGEKDRNTAFREAAEEATKLMETLSATYAKP
jgi:multiple sugar transport system substrate-binding protein